MSATDGPGESLLDERLEIETPERVLIVHDLAGIGSRFAAGLIDFAILAFAFFVLGSLVVVVAGVAMPRTAEAVTAMSLAATGLFTAVLAAYYLGFEGAWNGQTPGKRALRLRVIGEDGLPAGFGAIFLRNVLRVVDLLPGVAPYALAGVVMFANRRSKRVGDFAAGTIVVRERTEELVSVRADPAAVAAGDALGAADTARVREFARRSARMIPARRSELARAIAADLAERYRFDLREDPERVIERLARGTSPARLRDAQGPKA